MNWMGEDVRDQSVERQGWNTAYKGSCGKRNETLPQDNEGNRAVLCTI